MLEIYGMTLGPIQENGYVVVNSETRKALIFDPGEEGARFINWIKENGWEPQAILLTHTHSDHIGAVDEVRDAFDIEVYVYELEADWLVDPNKNLSAMQPFGLVSLREAEHIWTTEDLGEQTVGDFTFRLAHVPGHSPGHVIYIFDDAQFVVVGDAVFQGSIGRTDLPGGDYATLMGAIAREILVLPTEYQLYPGHGGATTVGAEMASNPFFDVFRR